MAMTVSMNISVGGGGSFSFRHALAYLHTSPSAIFEQVEDHSYKRFFRRIGKPPVFVRVREAPRSIDDTLLVDVAGDDLEEVDLEVIERRIRRIFSLDLDPAVLVKCSESDPVVGRLISRLPGARPVLTADPYECVIWAIAGQQVNVAFAKTLKTSLAELVGSWVEVEGRRYLVPPAPQDVMKLTVDQLRELHFSRTKAATILTVSEAIAGGDLVLDQLDVLSYEDAMRALIAFRGVGRWTAEYVLMRGLGFQDIIPAGDLGLQKAIGTAYGLDRKATESEVREISNPWSPIRGWLAYLWWFDLQGVCNEAGAFSIASGNMPG